MAKANMSLTRNQMPTQDPRIRSHNFDEVALGYSEETATNEAMRQADAANAEMMNKMTGGLGGGFPF